MRAIPKLALAGAVVLVSLTGCSGGSGDATPPTSSEAETSAAAPPPPSSAESAPESTSTPAPDPSDSPDSQPSSEAPPGGPPPDSAETAAYPPGFTPLPAPEGGTLKSQGQLDGGATLLISYTVPDAVAEVAPKYKAQLVADGWQNIKEQDRPNSAIWRTTKGDANVSITVNQDRFDESSSQVNIGYSK